MSKKSFRHRALSVRKSGRLTYLVDLFLTRTGHSIIRELNQLAETQSQMEDHGCTQPCWALQDCTTFF